MDADMIPDWRICSQSKSHNGDCLSSKMGPPHRVETFDYKPQARGNVREQELPDSVRWGQAIDPAMTSIQSSCPWLRSFADLKQ